MRDVDPKGLRVGIDGLGYMGLATGLAFAAKGWSVIGFDLNPRVREALHRQHLPLHEEGLDRLLRDQSRAGRFRVVDSVAELSEQADCIFLCLPTPSGPGGRIDLRPMRAGVAQLGRAIRQIQRYRLVVVKSTVVPGTTEDVVRPILLRYSCRGPDDLGTAANPEFLAEGSMVKDALHPARVVIGVKERRAAKMLRRIYSPFHAPIFELTPSGAELVKYSANAFLAMKVSFANEISRVAETVGTDVDKVMEAVGADERIGSRFLRAGPGFGGSCFDKDLRALVRKARDISVHLRLSEATLRANDDQAEHVRGLIRRAARRPLRGMRIALLGLSFKEDTDDVRESRAFPIVEMLLTEGAEVRAHDPVATVKFAAEWSRSHPGVSPRLRFYSEIGPALQGSDLAVLQTPWRQYARWQTRWTSLMRRPVVVDLRRFFRPETESMKGVKLVALGRGDTLTDQNLVEGDYP